MGARVEIRKMLLRGDIDGALKQIHALDHKMLDEMPDLRFALLRQRLLDIIAEGRIDAALTYAMEKLQPMVDEKVGSGRQAGSAARRLDGTSGGVSRGAGGSHGHLGLQ
eukprot:scaffold535_cov260-Pinguiococcus_pyrenoidosus.AAC.40